MATQIPLSKCLRFDDGRTALGRNGFFRPVSVGVTRYVRPPNDHIHIDIHSTGGSPAYLTLNLIDAVAVAEAILREADHFAGYVALGEDAKVYDSAQEAADGEPTGACMYGLVMATWPEPKEPTLKSEAAGS